jgi:hypothetical protein
MQIDEVAVDAGKDAARRAKGVAELTLAKDRSQTVGIRDVF